MREPVFLFSALQQDAAATQSAPFVVAEVIGGTVQILGVGMLFERNGTEDCPRAPAAVRTISRLMACGTTLLDKRTMPPKSGGRLGTAVCDFMKCAANSLRVTSIRFINELARLAERIGTNNWLIGMSITGDRFASRRFTYPCDGKESCFPKIARLPITAVRDHCASPRELKALQDPNDAHNLTITERVLSRSGDDLAAGSCVLRAHAVKPRPNDTGMARARGAVVELFAVPRQPLALVVQNLLEPSQSNAVGINYLGVGRGSTRAA